MDQTRSNGFFIKLGGLIIFAASIAFSLGWLVSPEAANRARNFVSTYVHRVPEVAPRPQVERSREGSRIVTVGATAATFAPGSRK